MLASASPARLATLRAAGLDPEPIVSGVDESQVGDVAPAELAGRLAALKAEAVAGRLAGATPTGPTPTDPARPETVVIGCDSVLELDGEAYGKPGTADVARARWRRMSGRIGVLHTGHCVIRLGGGRTDADLSARAEEVADTRVRFGTPTERELEAYLATGEPLQVAGAFTIDGLGGAFVESVAGDPHNVVGISLPLLRRLTARLGICWTDLWQVG